LIPAPRHALFWVPTGDKLHPPSDYALSS